MKTIEHKNMQIEDFCQFYSAVHKQHPEILGAEWDSEKKILKIFYEDTATELTEETLKNIQIPTVLRFRKKIALPKLDTATVVSATENELVIETHDLEATGKEVKQKLIEFEEVK